MEAIDIKVSIKKDIPEEQIEKFEDRTVYFTALLTRQYTANARAFPYLKGKLEGSELRTPIQHEGHASYSLLRGIEYASYVWKMSNVNWTNPSTRPQWYSAIYRQKEKLIVDTAKDRALEELK